MPKTPQSQPPSPVKQPANAPAPDKLDKMSEITLRKKKNADAQAAFRARRANYITTLEETGPSAAKYLNIHVPTTKCPGLSGQLKQRCGALWTEGGGVVPPDSMELASSLEIR
ncbi:uncharacterized protein FOMMEDRAFT_153037 [Fomitiporia mediterranea MF3/22]|uniref:uncharacterized protein n=1 Tax=Fomitiporia mediterranea (strain MF3/22) TaxID=694068 RepID=UPI0004408929|nr:uncharacterized protein FOMMEDRAFT_153037 [Fomitiporia mediterranea MF3/22]EJD05704.1 hypothetical protein FOMMEDRAFT_153037 [Fomitiporia mediterranea MF3/22]